MNADANLYALLRAKFQDRFDAPCFIAPDGAETTYSRIDALSAQFAAALRARGVGAGDRVIVQIGKSTLAVALYLACLRVGAIYAPLNTAYTEAETAYFLADAEPALFIAERTSAAPLPVEILQTTFWMEGLKAAPDHALAPRVRDDVAAIVYTSGTTGRSKGAMLTIGNLISNAETLVSLWGFTSKDVLLHALPIFHVHGLFVALHCAFLSACTTIFMPVFVAEAVRLDLRRWDVTVLMGVPTFYTRLLAVPAFNAEDCATMRLFISGSAPLLAETHRAFEARTGHRILERYGMSEAGMITSNPLDGARTPGTVGYPLPGVSLRIVGDDGATVPPGEPGVIEIKGPNVFKGYWRMPEKTAQEFRDDGYFITGDIGVAAADGRVSIVGRAKDLIISGGYNIYPKEIEDVLDAVEGVAESAVIGAPHADFGEAPVALVTLRPGATTSVEALAAAAAEKLARFKHPRRILIVDGLPRNAMGKVQKAALRERYRDLLR
ncbi:MAG: AMP-binding protein [Alphaproteobacteria bacterium]|nr:AMP-binding protein [Alphaproteobacteria bacterium]